MNEHEARLAIITRVRDVLLDLADDGTEDVTDLSSAMLDASELIIEAIGLEVITTDPLTVSLTIPED